MISLQLAEQVGARGDSLNAIERSNQFTRMWHRPDRVQFLNRTKADPGVGRELSDSSEYNV